MKKVSFMCCIAISMCQAVYGAATHHSQQQFTCSHSNRKAGTLTFSGTINEQTMHTEPTMTINDGPVTLKLFMQSHAVHVEPTKTFKHYLKAELYYTLLNRKTIDTISNDSNLRQLLDSTQPINKKLEKNLPLFAAHLCDGAIQLAIQQATAQLCLEITHKKPYGMPTRKPFSKHIQELKKKLPYLTGFHLEIDVCKFHNPTLHDLLYSGIV